MPHNWLFQTVSPTAQPQQCHFILNKAAETNIQPLLARLPPPVRDTQAYFRSLSLYQVVFGAKRWAIGYSYGEASLYQGDSGAARFYREVRQGSLNPETSYSLQATLNRTAVNTLSIARGWDTPLARLTLTAHWLTIRRAQYGRLHGQKQGSQFTGELTLQTTRGIDAAQIDGQGFALDVALVMHPTSHWHIGIKVENLLSYLSIGVLQQIDARVLVDYPTPDPDGFLHAPPVLEGRTQTRSLRTHAMPLYHGIVAYQRSSTLWAFMGSHDFRSRAGIAFAKTGVFEWWCVLWLEPREWQLGFRYAGWELEIGFDQPDWNRARRFTARVRWGLRL